MARHLPGDSRGTGRHLGAGRWGFVVTFPVMDLTPEEQPVVRRAVAAYLEAKIDHKGHFQGATADKILDELNPSPVRWAELADFVIATADGHDRRKPRG